MKVNRIVGTVMALCLGSPILAQDLVATDLASPLAADLGTPFDVTATVSNLGSTDAGPFVVRIYGDSSPGVNSDDEYFGRTVVPGLAAGVSAPVTFSVQSPGDYRESIYYLAVVVDAEGDVDESDEDNNWFMGGTMTYYAAADLTIRTASVPASAAAGALVTLRLTHGNEGTGEACCFETGVFLSDNDTVTRNDTEIYLGYVHTLRPGEGDETIFNFTLPAETPLGTYQLGILADYDDYIDEVDETNNDFTAPFQVRNASGRLAFVTPPRVMGQYECSAAIRVQAQDLDGTPRAPAVDTKITLIRRSSMYLYSDPLCSHETDFTVLEAASNLATFYVDYLHPGRRTVTAAAPELLSVDQTQLIAADPEDGETYVGVTYEQRSRKVVAGQAVRLELAVTVHSDSALEDVTLQPAHVGLQTISIDGVPVNSLDGSIIVGGMEPGEQRVFEIEAMPELGRLTASSLVVTGFVLEGDSTPLAVVSPEVEMVITGRRTGLGAECGSTSGGGAHALLLVGVLALVGRRRR